MGCPTASLVLRVYQFRHDRIGLCVNILFLIFLQYVICFSTVFMIKSFMKINLLYRKGQIMKIISRALFCCSVCLMGASSVQAAGTYPTGAYQSPQTRYGQQMGYYNRGGYNQQGYASRNNMQQRAKTTRYSQQGVSAYNRNQYANAGYSSVSAAGRPQQPVNAAAGQVVSSTENGFTFDAGLSKQTAMWQFEMKDAGSKLHYDNIDWLVFNAGGKYVFGSGNNKFQIDAGLQYGMQTGETTMNDDDISHGGYPYGEYLAYNEQGDLVKVGDKVGHALSVGASEGGSMLGFHAGFGMKDFFKFGNLKITPSVGWRYLKYDLKTTNNKGMIVVNGDFDASCMTLADGSTQCWPLVGVYNEILNSPDFPGYTYFDADGVELEISANGSFVYPGTSTPAEPVYAAVNVGNWSYAEAEGTFYFEQPDVSHSYEVEWSGPYVALDMRYDINPTNVVTANVELGMPSYTAIGDQPYRFDWQHPKSVEDKAGVGSAFHFGLGANWATALTDSVALTVGLTYDYYSVADADATTYFNSDYYVGIYDSLVASMMQATGLGQLEAENVLLNGNENYSPNEVAIMIRELDQNGWKDTADGEIESFYKSMGIRVGLRAKF